MVALHVPVVSPTSWMWILLLLMAGVFGFVAQVSALLALHFPTGDLLLLQTLLTMGLQRETVSRGATGVYTQVIFAVVLERLFFGVVPSLLSLLGASIIMSSAGYVLVSGHRSRFCYTTCMLIRSALISWQSRSLPKAAPQTISLRRFNLKMTSSNIDMSLVST